MSSLNNGQYGPTSASPASTGGSGGHWTDSLPRRDFYSNIAPTGSLPRRDKAGLGRPEPPRPPQNFNNGGLNTRRRDGSLNRENTSTFKDAFMAGNKDKRNSTGNLYFSDSNTNQQDHPLSSLSNTLQQGSARIIRGLSGSQPVGIRDSNSSLSSMNSDYDPNDPQAMVSRELRTAAGDLGKELKNLITLMDQEEEAAQRTDTVQRYNETNESHNSISHNTKESP